MDSSQTHRFKERNRKLEFYESREFKDAEKARREASKPKEHEQIDHDRCWCPIDNRIKPMWICEREDHIELDNWAGSPEQNWEAREYEQYNPDR